jgi:hypothetical protein
MKQTIALIGVIIPCLAAGTAEDVQTTENSKREPPLTNASAGFVSVRYMIDDVEAAVAFYTSVLYP